MSTHEFDGCEIDGHKVNGRENANVANFRLMFS